MTRLIISPQLRRQVHQLVRREPHHRAAICPAGLVPLQFALYQRQRPDRRSVLLTDDARIEEYLQGSFGFGTAIRVAPGSHDINMIVMTQP